MPFKATAECVCLPSVGFVCKNCEEKETNPLHGLGYERADQDGYNGDGQEYCSPEEHNEEILIEAAKVELDAKEI